MAVRLSSSLFISVIFAHMDSYGSSTLHVGVWFLPTASLPEFQICSCPPHPFLLCMHGSIVRQALVVYYIRLQQYARASLEPVIIFFLPLHILMQQCGHQCFLKFHDAHVF